MFRKEKGQKETTSLSNLQVQFIVISEIQRYMIATSRPSATKNSNN
jgi:hypothetical protein